MPVFTKFYEQLVVPILDRAAEVWGFKDYNSIISTLYSIGHRAIFRCALILVCPVSSFSAFLERNGFVSFKIIRHMPLVRFCNRLVSMEITVNFKTAGICHRY